MAKHTHALVLVILVNEDMVHHKAKEFRLESRVWIKHQRLKTFSTSSHQLVAKNHQEITEQHESLKHKVIAFN